MSDQELSDIVDKIEISDEQEKNEEGKENIEQENKVQENVEKKENIVHPTPIQQSTPIQHPQNSNVYYDREGRPIYPVNMNQQPRPIKVEKKPRIGQFVAALITLVLGIGFTAFSTYYFISIFLPAQDGDSSAILGFILYIFSGVGLLLSLPGIGCSIASLICSCFSVKSSKKGIRIVSGFVIAFSIIAIVLSIILPFILFSLVSA